MDSLTLVELVTVTAVGGVVAGLVVAFVALFVRPRLASARATEPDSELAGLVEKAVLLDGQVTNLHSLMVELLQEQSGVKAGVAVTAEQTAELHRVLANTKHRGDWGEILAEDVLVHAGLVHQVNYVRQQQMRYGRGRPDFTFTMPDGLELNLDAKFPLENYRRMEQAETDEERDKARKAFAADIKRHIKTLADRGYADREHTVGFCLLFIANRGIFDAIAEASPDILKYAMARNVAICCPQTLMSVLIIVRNAANSFRVQRRTIDVLRCVESFQAEWDKFTNHIDTTDKQLNTFCGSWQTMKGTRRNQLQKRLDSINELDVSDISDQQGTDSGQTEDVIEGDKMPELPEAA